MEATFSFKRITFITLLFCSLLTPRVAWAAITGSGTEASPYLIGSSADMTDFRARIDGGTNASVWNSVSTYYKLTASFTWIDFGNTVSATVRFGIGSEAYPFKGVFDGGGYTLTLPATTAMKNNDRIGLFEATQDATVRNLNLSCGYLDGNNKVSPLIGYSGGSLILQDVHVYQNGITDIYGTHWGGLVGSSKGNSKSLVMENCSYINAGTVNFKYPGGFMVDAGGLIGNTDSHSSVTITDCLVRHNNLSFIDNSYNMFGGLVGYTLDKITMIRCVQAKHIPTVSTDLYRNYVVGYGATINGFASYAYSTPYSKNTEVNGFTTHTDWSAINLYNKLERMDNSGKTIASNTAGNKRWSFNNTEYPTVSSKAYVIKVTKGSGISSITGTNIENSGNYYYINSDKQMTVKSDYTPTSHQRVDYTFKTAYSGNTTETKSGNNLLLTSESDGTVSANLINIPYPYTNTNTKANAITAEFKPFEKTIALNWHYDNRDSLKGKFYVYLRDEAVPESATAYTLVNKSGISVKSGTDIAADIYNIPSASISYNKKYTIEVCFWEDGLGNPPDNPQPLYGGIVNANKAWKNGVSTTVTAAMFGNWKITATGGDNKITVTMLGIDTCFTNAASYKYTIQRSINGSTYQDWLANQSFSAQATYTHDDIGITTPCDAYKYKVIIAAFDTTFVKETGEAHSTGATAFLPDTETPFKATKGEHSNYVRLQWKVNRNGSGTDDMYRIFRRVANTSGAWNEMETVYSNAGTVYWNDNTALTGVYYEYKVILYQSCSSSLTQLADRTDIGFTQAFGTVSGRVTFGSDGSPVQDVKMLVRRNQLMEREAQYHSLKSIGGGQYFEWKGDSAYFNNIWTKDWTLQFWVNPDGSNTDAVTIGTIGSYAITMMPVTGGYQIYTSFGTTYLSEIIPANKFSHITITRNGNDVKIYTVHDANPDSIYIKNIPFTSSPATAQLAADCKISFGHGLKGYVDDARFWNRALPEDEILRDYSRILTGGENGLAGYWTFDEGLEGYAFDRSRVGTVYNNNHATTVTLPVSDEIPDDEYQLALKGITDADGNYQINGIGYQGEGTSYSIVPKLGNVIPATADREEIDGRHKFNPTQQLRYISPSSMVHNATDFSDVSAFMLRGTVTYEGGNYPVADCMFEVDGRTLIKPNGEVIKSDVTGYFEISVPIGQHSVRVVKTGHTFAGGGYLKDTTGVDYVYYAPRANIKDFIDQTKVKLLGRVVGGNTEDGKPLGFGESVNNIGVETIELHTTQEQYNFSHSAVSKTYSHNNGHWKRPGGLADDSTVVDYNQKNITIHVSPTTGEFSAMVYPEPYNIMPISVSQGNLPELPVKKNAENIDLSATAAPDESFLQFETRTWKDSSFVANRPGVIDHWEYSEKSDTVRYNSKWTFKYQATPTFGVVQLVDSVPVAYFGEKTYELKDEHAGTSETLDLYDETTGEYLFDNKPVFQQGKIYNFRFNAYEAYTNYVSSPAVPVTYPVSNGKIDLTNNLQVTTQPETIEMDSAGTANYAFKAGPPNITTATNNFNAILILGAVGYNWDKGGAIQAWQLGDKGSGSNFMTSGPAMLTAILRDPPGSNSYAYIEEGTTITNTTTYTAGATVAEELNITSKFGLDVETFVGIGGGVVTSVESKADLLNGLTSEQSYSYSNESSVTTTFKERFQTSASSDYVGATGDVFIGNSTNIIYGLTDGVKIKKGVVEGTPWATAGDYKIAPTASIAYGPDFITRFAYTEMELEDIMLPKWRNSIALRLLPYGTPEPTGNISSPVYISNLPSTDPNYGKWNLNDVFKGKPKYDRKKPYEGESYTVYFPNTPEWAVSEDSIGEKMANFQDSVLWANNQINLWETVLALNEKEKVEMQRMGNYSFGGGAQIEYSAEKASTSSYSHSWGFNITPSIGFKTGGTVNGVGIEVMGKISLKMETSGKYGTSEQKNKTTGFVLAEEGIYDEITVDYGITESGTFAFKTLGGQTSCPYEDKVLSKYFEPGMHILQEATMQVEVPVLDVSSTPSVLNVPANRTANFTLALQNPSESKNNVWLELIVAEATNPNGAELKIDGIGIGNGRQFYIHAGEVLTKTLTVSKGTVDNYDNIGIILRSPCQWWIIADTVYVSAHFVPACSDVTIAQPANNFIVNTENPKGNVLSVTLQNFDVNFPNFGYVRLEYRPAGTPNWYTARTFYPSNLFNSPTNTDVTKEDIGARAVIVYDWAMPTADGQYELRATTASVNIVNDEIVGNPLSTYSTTAITGYKDMVKPKALGAPSPASGIYGAGDELSVTFNEDINTAMLILDNINVTYDNNIPVPISFVASSNKITMEYPGDYFAILEGKTLHIEVKDVYDMHGNKSEPVAWTAFVNRNPLVWETAELNLIKTAGETLTFNATIKNASNQMLSYSFPSLPQWLSVNLPTGNLQPLQSRELTFTISSGVNLGEYTELIGVTSGNGIVKNLPLNLRVTGTNPAGWSVNPAGYESTMTVTGRIQIGGAYRTDGADILAAFIGNECVGMTSPIKPVAENPDYYTFLTIYGNSAHAGQPIKFKIWDAGTGNIYPVVETWRAASLQDITFTANAIIGSSSIPVIHNAVNMIEQSIALNNGWNWISANVLNSSPTILQQFKDRAGAAGEMLKGQNGYIQATAWTGTLTSIEKEQAYLVKTNTATTLRFDGTPADPATSPITLVNGWNWIGYIPQFTLPVNEALANLTAQTDDQVKGHASYRTYAGAGTGWVGTLNYMRPGEGYMYNSGAGKTFSYPAASSQVYHAPMRAAAETAENHWATDVHKYSGSMTMTSIVLADNAEMQSDLIEIAAFAGNGECRGSIMLQNVPEISEHPYLGFLMVFGENGDNLILKVYDHAASREYTASNAVSFATDAIHGTPGEPYRILFSPTGINKINIEQVTVYPNPVSSELRIANYGLRIDNVKIYDALGRMIFITDAVQSSINVSGFVAGIYTIQITTSEGVVSRKFVKR